MTKNEIKHAIRERTNPIIFHCSYLATRAHLRTFKRCVALFSQYAEQNNAPCRVLDVGCGYKPFEKMVKDGARVGEYIGVDFDKNRSYADVESTADVIPFPHNYFDVVLATEILEHVPDARAAVNEMRRVAKPGALIYISTPFMFPEHGIPYDFNRFTRYAFEDFFSHDEIIIIAPTNTSFATVRYTRNLTFKSITIFSRIPVLSHIVYALNNIAGLIEEYVIMALGMAGTVVFQKRRAWFSSCFENYFYRMPAGYDVIVKIKKS